MKNKEFWAKEIVEIALNSDCTVGVIDGKPCSCNITNCSDGRCQFSGHCITRPTLKEWGNAEYHEPVPKLTELEVEELTYISHAIPNAKITGYGWDNRSWYAMNGDYFKPLMYQYENLDKTKQYDVGDLLRK